jgi:hypothetical protein
MKAIMEKVLLKCTRCRLTEAHRTDCISKVRASDNRANWQEVIANDAAVPKQATHQSTAFHLARLPLPKVTGNRSGHVCTAAMSQRCAEVGNRAAKPPEMTATLEPSRRSAPSVTTEPSLVIVQLAEPQLTPSDPSCHLHSAVVKLHSPQAEYAAGS